MSEVRASWDRITGWLQAHAPQAMATHQSGVSPGQLSEFENAIGQNLPADVKQFYQIVNGEDPNQASTGIFPSCDDHDQMAFGPLSIEQIQRESAIQRELLEGGDFEGCEPEKNDPEIRNESWNTAWIPIAGNGGGDLYCIDMSPAEGGIVGQVISHNHESFDHQVLATSFHQYLEKLAGQLERGELTFSENWGVCKPG